MPNLVFGVAGAETVRNRFRQFNITLPAVPASTATVALRAAPTAASSMSSLGSQPSQPLKNLPALFRAASNSAADLANQRAMHQLYDSMFQQLIEAIEFGFNRYRQMAGLVDVIINGPIALGGRLIGPNLDGLIMTAPSVSSWTSPQVVMREAVAKGLHQQWSTLADSVRVTGLPWYPAFAAFPGPMAPPMPNVPMPFAVLAHNAAAVTSPALKVAMQSRLRGRFDYSDQFFESFSTGFELAMQIWKATQMVTQVLGTGPVPTFAPPYVPVGPVVGGNTLPGMHINT